MNSARKYAWLLLASLTFPGLSLANDDAKGIPVIEKERMASHEVDASKMKFKPGKGLQISSTNGQFQLTTRLRAQMRYTLEQDGGEFAHGFQLRRARLLFTGHVFGKVLVWVWAWV